jgi:uncharacterized membrane protein
LAPHSPQNTWTSLKSFAPQAEHTNGLVIVTATAEKGALIERLRVYLDETSRQSLLTRKSAEGTSAMEELSRSPMTIFIG